MFVLEGSWTWVEVHMDNTKENFSQAVRQGVHVDKMKGSGVVFVQEESLYGQNERR